MFGALKGWFERRSAFRELRALEGPQDKGFSKFFSEQIEDAKNAFDRGDRSWALKTWHDMNLRYPKLSMTSENALNLLVDLGGYDEAEALLRSGRLRYPWHRAIFAAVSARIAYSRGDLDEALRRCEILRRKFPRVAEGYTIATSCFEGLGRQDEAEAMIGRAALRFPHNFDIAVAYARHAARREDWPEALRRWTAVNGRFDNFLGPLGMAQCLRELHRYAEAKELATEVCDCAPWLPWGYSELADIAAAEGDLEGLAQRWEVARDRCPDFARAYVAGAEAERRLGHDGKADKILYLAVTRLRFNLDVHLKYARDAVRRGDPAAAERWALVRERFPECREAHGHDEDRGQAAEGHKTGACHAAGNLSSEN